MRPMPRLTRRAALAAAAAALLAGRVRRPATAQPATRPLVGAIRWDAWQAPGSAETRAVERSLSPPRYRHRLPFFAEIHTDGAVAIDGGRQAVMDREIALAAEAGLDFWAFVAYPQGSPMSVVLELFLSSERRAGMRFCLISEIVQWRSAARPSDAPERHARLMRHPDHLRVLDGRPLYFLGFLTDRLIAERWGGTEALRDAVAAFRARAAAEGAGNPYITVMARPHPGARLATAIGADALGAYTIADNAEAGAPYAWLAALAERRWDEMAATGLPIVPTVMAGWDRRPRVENPVPWERSQRPGVGLDRFYHAPRPEELAAHLRRALAWIERHPRAAPARAALIYAWNENDEGGWLVPTLPFDTARLDALRGVLAR
jgi:hypothetical protein